MIVTSIGLDFGRCAEFGAGVIWPFLSGQGQPERMVQAGPRVEMQSLFSAHSLRRQGAKWGKSSRQIAVATLSIRRKHRFHCEAPQNQLASPSGCTELPGCYDLIFGGRIGCPSACSTRS
jgi:hypothetical protein